MKLFKAFIHSTAVQLPFKDSTTKYAQYVLVVILTKHVFIDHSLQNLQLRKLSTQNYVFQQPTIKTCSSDIKTPRYNPTVPDVDSVGILWLDA